MWSLCLKVSSWLWLIVALSPVSLAHLFDSRGCVGKRCAPNPGPVCGSGLVVWAALLLMSAGAAGSWVSPLDVHRWPQSPSIATTSPRGIPCSGGRMPPWSESMHTCAWRSALFYDISVCWVKDLLSPGAVPGAWPARLQKWAWPRVVAWCKGKKGLVALE